MADRATVPDEVRAEMEHAEQSEVQQQPAPTPEAPQFSVFKRPEQAQPVPPVESTDESDIATSQDASGQPEGEDTSQTEQHPPQEEQLTPQEKNAYEKLAENDPALHKVLELGKESIYQHIQEKDDLEDWQVELIRQRFAKEQPKDVVEYVTKLRMLKDLQEEHGLSDDEIVDWEQAFNEMSVAEVQQYMDGLVPDFIAEGYQLDIRGETDDDDQEETSDDPEEKAEDPLPKDQVEQVEAAGEDKTKEAELTAQAAKAVEQLAKVTAWKEYAKLYPPPQEPREFLDEDKKVPNPDYQAEKQLYEAAMIEYRKAFDQFWQEKFLPKIKAEQEFIKDNPKPPEKLPDGSDNPEYAAWVQKLNEFSETFDAQSTTNADAFKDKGKTLAQQAKEAGLDYLFTHYTNSDLSTTFKAIFGTHDSYRAGNVNWVEADHGESTGKTIDVLGFKEMVGWSSDKEKGENNKKRWLLLCSLMGRQLKGTKLENLNPDDWLSEDGLKDHKVKEHMLLFYEESVKAGKGNVDKALNKAFEDPKAQAYGNIVLRKPGQDVQVTSELMAHIQMMGNHIDHVQNFFGG